eukprot:CAMPEP_0117676966 /NCGR_PEP_ID=MMETSP0804-20121206/16493_1 /TAXON_ID=1074897 /ORGANISM="Tetraselmis astigmatica, Strain CCMP880" /LENGTH=118 /DNA_ID=CAMNT_0005486217 /DNA_START=338 /DNA_END=694 /DNA_ORIENTATION=+
MVVEGIREAPRRPGLWGTRSPASAENGGPQRSPAYPWDSKACGSAVDGASLMSMAKTPSGEEYQISCLPPVAPRKRMKTVGKRLRRETVSRSRARRVLNFDLAERAPFISITGLKVHV